jgi:hypothetical protein
MPKPLQIEVNGGVVTRKAPDKIQANELVSGVGLWYVPGDEVAAYKIDGRHEYANGSQIAHGLPIKGILGAVCLC